MRVEAGSYHVEATDGRVAHVDQPLTREQVDVFLGVIDRAGYDWEHVCWVELSEGGCEIETAADRVARLRASS